MAINVNLTLDAEAIIGTTVHRAGSMAATAISAASELVFHKKQTILIANPLTFTVATDCPAYVFSYFVCDGAADVLITDSNAGSFTIGLAANVPFILSRTDNDTNAYTIVTVKVTVAANDTAVEILAFA